MKLQIHYFIFTFFFITHRFWSFEWSKSSFGIIWYFIYVFGYWCYVIFFRNRYVSLYFSPSIWSCKNSSKFPPKSPRNEIERICKEASKLFESLTKHKIHKSGAENILYEICKKKKSCNLTKILRFFYLNGAVLNFLNFKRVYNPHGDITNQQECHNLSSRFTRVMIIGMNSSSLGISNEQ